MPQTVATSSDAAPTAAPTGAVRGASERDSDPLSHLSGLDGLRAIAVLAVIAYHAGSAQVSGGFLGVEVFFVISGYLITALLLAEHRRHGRIDFVRFWLRRARRLLPALFFLLAAILAFAVVVVPDEIARLRTDALAAMAYLTNWHLIAGDQSYFETIGRPSLFLHLWSLAIEEQFYLLWPVVLAVLLMAGRRTGLALTLVGAIGSAAWMAFLFDPGADPSRLYYGTDTRLTGLLLGAALAFIWVPVTTIGGDGTPIPRVWTSRRVGKWLDLVGVMGLAGLGLFFVAADAFEPYLYRGGLALLAVVTTAVIAAAVHPRARVGRLMDRGPMRWIGTRSYAIYLWHWPIFTLTRPDLDLTLDPLSLLVVRLGLTAIMAEISYRLVEMPIRRGALGRAWKRPAPTKPASVWQSNGWTAPARAGALAMLLSAVLVSVAMATPPALPDGMVSGSIDGLIVPAGDLALQRPTAGVASWPAVDLTPHTTDAEPDAGPATPSPTAEASPMATPTARPRPTILAFGESVMIQGAKALVRDLGPVRVDAAVGRQIDEGISILEHRAATGALAGVVIVQLGNNGPFYDGQFDEIMAALRNVPVVVWINVRVPREWEGHNNRIIAGAVRRYPNARMVDWNAATAGRPDLFWKDGYHPRPAGARLYADLVAAALQ
jgi:peptidoglycan/LPS O-acetylase OafA/YrhL